MRFPLKKLLPIVAAICLLSLLSIGILKPSNSKEDPGTANNITSSSVDKYHLYTELANVCMRFHKLTTYHLLFLSIL